MICDITVLMYLHTALNQWKNILRTTYIYLVASIEEIIK